MVKGAPRTIYTDPVLWEEAKILADECGLSLSHVVTSLLRDWTHGNREQSKLDQIRAIVNS